MQRDDRRAQAAAALTAGCLLLAAAACARSPEAGSLGPTDATGGTTPVLEPAAFRPGPVTLLAVTGRASSQMGALEVAVGDEVAPRWAALQLPGAAPELDPASEALVVFTVPDDLCPEALAGLGELGSGVLEPELVRIHAGCESPLIPRTYAVAVDRTALPADGATVRLPASRPST